MIMNYALDMRFGWTAVLAIERLQSMIRVLCRIANLSKLESEVEMTEAAADAEGCPGEGADSAVIRLEIGEIEQGIAAGTLATRDIALLAIQSINCMIELLKDATD